MPHGRPSHRSSSQARQTSGTPQGTERRPVDPGRRQPGGTLPGSGQPDVGIQGGEQPAARPGGLSPQREHRGPIPGHHVQDLRLGQLGHARDLAQRTDPGQAGKAITVGSVRLRRSAARRGPDPPARPTRQGNPGRPAPRRIRTSPDQARRHDHPARDRSPPHPHHVRMRCPPCRPPDVRLGLQQAADPFADDLIVVQDEHADRRCRRTAGRLSAHRA